MVKLGDMYLKIPPNGSSCACKLWCQRQYISAVSNDSPAVKCTCTGMSAVRLQVLTDTSVFRHVVCDMHNNTMYYHTVWGLKL